MVIFNKDPLLPFEFADKQKRHLNVTDSESKSDESGTDTGNGIEKEVGSNSGMDQLMARVQKLEDQRNKVFGNAHSNIKKLRHNRLGCTIAKIVLASHLRLATMC